MKAEGSVDESSAPVIKKIYRQGTVADPLRGLFERTIHGRRCVVEYESDTDLRETQQVPLTELGGVDAFIKREVLPYASDSWYVLSSMKVGYEISFNRYFAKPIRSRNLDDLQADISTTERATEGLIESVFRTVIQGSRQTSVMKSIGQDWLGEIPQDWELIPLRALVRQRKEVVGDRSKDFTLLSLTLKGIVPRDMENPQGKFPADFSTYQVVKPGDLVFCLFDVDETPRTVGLSRHNGMITGAYTVFEPRKPELVEFAYMFFLAMDHYKQLRPLYTGLRKVIPRDTLLQIRVPMPPKEEREQIMRLLKVEDAKIDEVINAINRQAKSLRQYRARLVADVVTGKLDVHGAASSLSDYEAKELPMADEVLGGAEGTDLVVGGLSEEVAQ